MIRDCRYGHMIFNPDDRFIGRGLDLYGEFSEGEVEVFRQFLRPGDHALDVGANIGCHTVAMARLVGPSGRLLAFEPERGVYTTLCGNLAINNLMWVEAMHVAVGDRIDVVAVPDFDLLRSVSIGTLDLEAEYPPEARRYEVPLVTIDSLRLDRCDLIKVDVEGMEPRVLAGATATVARFWPVLYVESDRQPAGETCVRMLRDWGYTVCQHVPPLYNPDNLYGRPNIFGTVVSSNLLGLPPRLVHSMPPDLPHCGRIEP